MKALAFVPANSDKCTTYPTANYCATMGQTLSVHKERGYYMPSDKANRDKIHSFRGSLGELPLFQYQNVNDIRIPQELTKTIDGQRWLLFDTLTDFTDCVNQAIQKECAKHGIPTVSRVELPFRLIMFASDIELEALGKSNQWSFGK